MDLLDQLRILKDGLARADGRLEELFSSTQIGACLIGVDGRFQRLNSNWENCLGHATDSILGKTFLDFVHPDDRRSTELATAKLQSDTTVRFWNRFRQSDGNYRTLQWAASPADTEGRICAVALASAGGDGARVMAGAPSVDAVLDATGLSASPAELYRSVVETSPDAILVTDLTGRVLIVNEQAVLQNGLESADQLLGLNAFDFIMPEDRARAVENTRLTLETGGVRNVEYELLRRDGERMVVELSASLVRNPAGQPCAFIAMVRDITKRKRAAEAHRETEERYRSIVETSPDAITLTGLDRKIVICNQQAAALLGYDSTDEILGIDALDLVAPDERKAAVEDAQEAFRTGSLRNARYGLVKKDGTVFPGEVSASVIRDAAGIVAGYTAVLRDISRRERTLNALRASEERYRILYQDNPSMYFTVDADGTVLSVNQFGAEQLGYEVGELLGKPVLGVFFEDDKRDVAEQLAVCFQSPGEVHHWEFRKVRKDGRVIWVREAARATRDAKGETIVLIVCEDITERRLMEEELQRAREALENKVERQMVRGRAYGLTFRELTVLHLVSAGSSDKDIAEKLGISPLTVSKHVANVLTKMGAATRSEASARAVRESIVD